jgi:hypothetical protein
MTFCGCGCGCCCRQYDQREAAHGAPPDEHTLWLWKDSDWRKWEQEERWAWEPAARKKWAEELFRQQAQRHADRLAAAKQQQQKRYAWTGRLRAAVG